MPTDERLTRHFFLSQLTVSPLMGQAGLRNQPLGQQIENLRRLAQTLEVVRAHLDGATICVLRAFRVRPHHLPVGSVDDAAGEGRSAEFIAPEFGSPREICAHLVAHGVAFDRLVNAGDWVQLDIPPVGRSPRRQVQTGCFEFAAPMRYMEGLL